jgi:hypothetical protein
VDAGDTPGDHPNRPQNITNSTFALSGQIDQSDDLGGGCSVADMSVSLMGHSLSVPLSKVCDPAAILGNIAVALCLFAVPFIVFKG